MKQTSIKHNGTMRAITGFTFNGTTASGYVQGHYIECPIGTYNYAYKTGRVVPAVANAKHCVINAHDRIYGNNPLSHADRAKCRRKDVTDARIKNLGSGRVRLTCKVNGEPITIDYEGTVSNDNGEVFTAKPFLGAARDDARRKANKTRPNRIICSDDVKEMMAELERRRREEAEIMEMISSFIA